MKAKKYILTAVTIEIMGTLFLFSLLYTLFFGIKDTLEILHWLLFSIFIGCTAAYGFGWFMSGWFPNSYNFRKWQAVVIIFSLLIIGIIAGMLSLSLTKGNDINAISDLFPVILVFLLFGSLPTLGVGLWLGNRLQRKLNN